MKINRNNYTNVLKAAFGRSNLLNSEDCAKIKKVIKSKGKLPVMFNDIKESAMYLDYAIIVYGVTPCGSKITVIIEDINPSLDIEFDPSLDKAGNLKRVQDLLGNKALTKKLKGAPQVHSLKLRKGKKLIGYEKEESSFIKISFKNFWHRKEFIKLLKKKGIKSFNNDESSYYRVVGRQYKLYLSGWNTLENYTVLTDSDYKTKYVVSISVDSISCFDESDFSDFSHQDFMKDKLISMAFDIEQYSSDFDVENINRYTRLPSGEILEDTIFNIGMTFHFINQPKEILGLSLITENCKEQEGYITIICDTEKTILLAFAFIIELIQPDIIYEFNGSDFDWPNIYQKAKLLKIQDEMLSLMSMNKLSKSDIKSKDIYIFKTDQIKISADMSKSMTNIRLHGYVAFDLRVSLMQLNSTESKSSLAFYLEIYDMPGKDDMPISQLFKYFATKDYDGLGDVAKYCFIDCLRLHQLAYKINLIQDRKAIGLLSYTSLFDSFYRANSSKVRNLVVSHAIDKNLFYDSIKEEVSEADQMEGKYPGAWVLSPETGLVNPIMSFEEFCKMSLKIEDKKLIASGLEILKKAY